MLRSPYLPALLFGAATAALALLFPSIPKAPGVIAPILELEFARIPEDVQRVTAGFDEATVAAFRANIAHDRWFILAYAGFLALLCSTTARLREAPLLFAGVILAMGAGVFDHLENSAMLNVLDTRVGDMQDHLHLLHRYTWLKWGSISATFLLLTPFLWRSGRMGRGVAVFAGLTAFAAVSAFVNPTVVQPFTGLVSLMFLLLFAWAGLASRG